MLHKFPQSPHSGGIIQEKCNVLHILVPSTLTFFLSQVEKVQSSSLRLQHKHFLFFLNNQEQTKWIDGFTLNYYPKRKTQFFKCLLLLISLRKGKATTSH